MSRKMRPNLENQWINYRHIVKFSYKIKRNMTRVGQLLTKCKDKTYKTIMKFNVKAIVSLGTCTIINKVAFLRWKFKKATIITNIFSRRSFTAD